MKLKPHLMVLMVLLCALWLAQNALAMSSTHYRLDWFTPLTTGGGGAANSAHYAVNFAIGQTASGLSASANYEASLGYWSGAMAEYRVFLPVVLKG